VTGAAPAADDYGAFSRALLDTGLVTDPWVDARPRFATAPLRLSATEAHALADAAEAVAGAFHEVALAAAADPALLDDFFALTPVQKLLWQCSAPLWHGVARADVFFVPGPTGPRAMICELNADTPSGQPEAVLLGPATGVPAVRDPNRRLEARFGQLLGQFLSRVARVDRRSETATVGVVYPTELAGDLGLVRLYQRWCERLGLRVVLGSPFNLQRAPGGGVALFGSRCDLLLRHYKTDWWGERLPLWSDEDPYPDAEPLAGPLRLVLDAVAEDRCAVVNPCGAVLVQNKRAMAFLWERRAHLSPAARAAVEAHLPPTFRLEVMDHAQLRAEQADWVLKSDYGCEGEEVLIGAAVPPEEWQAALEKALPSRFVVQRYFAARKQAVPGADDVVVNHGVYLVGGQASGIYARAAGGATDAGALSLAVEVVPGVVP
jgi:glutathionylspermidine synthase